MAARPRSHHDTSSSTLMLCRLRSQVCSSQTRTPFEGFAAAHQHVEVLVVVQHHQAQLRMRRRTPIVQHAGTSSQKKNLAPRRPDSGRPSRAPRAWANSGVAASRAQPLVHGCPPSTASGLSPSPAARADALHEPAERSPPHQQGVGHLELAHEQVGRHDVLNGRRDGGRQLAHQQLVVRLERLL